jgi:hypothetical protein
MPIVRFPRLRPTPSRASIQTPSMPSSRSISPASNANSSDLLMTWERLAARVATLIVLYPRLGGALVAGVERLLNRLRF